MFVFIPTKHSIWFQVQFNISHSSQATRFHNNSMDVITIGLKFGYLIDFRARITEDQENYFFEASKIKRVTLSLFSCKNVFMISLKIIWNNWLVGNCKRNMDLSFQYLQRQNLIYIFNLVVILVDISNSAVCNK